ncbi:Adenosine (5')-pentaphospho-(5'')-adenosine pyrophosphohydrolase [Paramagnetospirillum magnetotacticum MS-1]|uniref:RNA pyrophosphohydrolase n=1 Tax=Paramagnetospirillum magnetotacticum MS-1 TaxID=272627 RepID=A0A0C2YU20_PARME|nr:RNA pyrophosphohydrolase [Paramagnetospirillum magnetotacticum]KIL98195.1 Adenosine (5')-pentaphospho-(5'')-adenosine pyrophosphohydrolase [Paramagnetospirillum magnetotacticum MS-1]
MSKKKHKAPLPYDQRPYRPGIGLVLLNTQGLAFVAQRVDTPGTAWQFPQGGIDEGEDPRATVLREMEEEIGTAKAEIIAESRDWISYDLPPDIADKSWKGRFRGQTQKWFCARFTGSDADINLETEHPEFCRWRWMALEEIPPLIIPFKRVLYDKVVAEFLPIAQAMASK